MALALPASAHQPTIKAYCDADNNQMVLSIDLTAYNGDGNKNTVWATDQPEGGKLISLLPSDKADITHFGESFHATFNASSTVVTGPADVVNTFEVKVRAFDFPKNKDYSPDKVITVQPCVKDTPPPTPPPSDSSVPPPPSSNTPPASTTSVAPAAAATTPAGPPGSSTLPNTGVNAGLPLGIAGALVIIGGGLLFWLRFNARRRTS
jgi:LPXTG-motif cell wall-anchored protein